MKNITSSLKSILVVVALATGSAPIPAAAQDNPTLNQTNEFIRNSLRSAVRKFSVREIFKYDVSTFKINGCVVRLRTDFTENNGRVSVSRDVSWDWENADIAQQEGSSVIVRGRIDVIHERIFHSGGTPNQHSRKNYNWVRIYYGASRTAERVTNAMNHAIELCAGQDDGMFSSPVSRNVESAPSSTSIPITDPPGSQYKSGNVASIGELKQSVKRYLLASRTQVGIVVSVSTDLPIECTIEFEVNPTIQEGPRLKKGYDFRKEINYEEKPIQAIINFRGPGVLAFGGDSWFRTVHTISFYSGGSQRMSDANTQRFLESLDELGRLCRP